MTIMRAKSTMTITKFKLLVQFIHFELGVREYKRIISKHMSVWGRNSFPRKHAHIRLFKKFKLDDV